MGFLKGKASFSSFSARGNLPVEDRVGFIQNRLATYSFKDIDDTFDEYSVGWVSVVDMFSTNFSLAINGQFVAIKLRIDERTASGAVLKKFVAKEELRVREERQVPRLSRETRMQIKERVRVELVRNSKPGPKVVDIAWDILTGSVLVFSTSDRVLSIATDFFKESFGLTLEHAHGDDNINRRTDFLTWLFCEYVKHGISSVESLPVVTIDGEDIKVSCSNDRSTTEAVFAISRGGMVSKLAMILESGANYTVSAKRFDLTSVRLSKVVTQEEGETIEGLMLERIALLQQVREDLDGRWWQFLGSGKDAGVVRAEIDELAREKFGFAQ